jgi:hypothetical protein
MSPRFSHPPFVQACAWPHVRAGANANFSFASHASSYVRFREAEPARYTPSLEWFPTRVRPSDIAMADYVLVNTEEEVHATLGSLGLEALSENGNWRLYRKLPSTSP